DPGTTVRLLRQVGGWRDVELAGVRFSAAASELQLFPAAPLKPGSYRVFLAGDAGGPEVLTDLAGTPLGKTDQAPDGQDYTFRFRVDGVEGHSGPARAGDDTPARANDLGALPVGAMTQIRGAIGDDPFYDSANPLLRPGADVDLYHFRVEGAGRYAFRAEVFAGRIGSPLDPGVSLF